MPGTRTVPTIDTALNTQFINVSISFIDYTGEQRTVTMQLDSTNATDANIESLVTAMQAITNASVYRVEKSFVFVGDKDKNNAVEVVWEDVKTNVVVLAKDLDNNSRNSFLPAPVNDIFIDGSEDLDPSDAALAAYLAAYVNVLPAGFALYSIRFTQRRDIGTKINL